MYQQIEEQIEESKINQQQLMVTGDFNCKVGEEIKGNKKEVTKGGRLLMKTIEKFDLQLMNATEICEGLWTREEKGKRSILDYVLVNQECVGAVEKMYIDEQKQITPYTRINKEEKTYTDHNTITVDVNWIVANKKQPTTTTTLTQKNKDRFKQETMKAGLCEIWEQNEEPQTAYTIWSRKVREIAEKIFQTKKRKRPTNRNIRKLRKKKQMLKKMMKEADGEEKKIMVERRKLIMEFINDIKEKQEESKVIEIAKRTSRPEMHPLKIKRYSLVNWLVG